MPKAIPGSISTGTMRPQDLIPTFRSHLKVIHPNPREVLKEHAYRGQGESSPFWDSEDVQYDLESLFTELDALAPEGYYFGAHPGDGSDYGFWQEDQDG